MSIATCTDCFEQVDTDFKPMFDYGEHWLCERCLLKFPMYQAKADYEHGGGLDDNPYEPDQDVLSDYQLYRWEMHTLHCLEGKGMALSLREQMDSFFERSKNVK